MIYTDGASRGNPGEAGIGIVIKNEKGETIRSIARYLGTATNNFAEYTALLEGLKAACALGVKEASVYLDSELVVRQVKGIYRVRHPVLFLLFAQIRSLLEDDGLKATFHHVPRKENWEADRLANLAIDRRL